MLNQEWAKKRQGIRIKLIQNLQNYFDYLNARNFYILNQNQPNQLKIQMNFTLYQLVKLADSECNTFQNGSHHMTLRSCRFYTNETSSCKTIINWSLKKFLSFNFIVSLLLKNNGKVIYYS